MNAHERDKTNNEHICTMIGETITNIALMEECVTNIGQNRLREAMNLLEAAGACMDA